MQCIILKNIQNNNIVLEIEQEPLHILQKAS